MAQLYAGLRKFMKLLISEAGKNLVNGTGDTIKMERGKQAMQKNLFRQWKNGRMM